MQRVLGLSLLVQMFVGPALASAQTIAARDSFSVLVEEAWQALDTTYFDTTFHGMDWAQARSELLRMSYHSRAEAHAAIAALLARLQQPATRFFTAEEFSAFFAEVTGQPHAGVGLLELLSVDYDERSGEITIVAPLPHSPAAQAGLQAHDVITRIGQRSTSGMSLKNAMQLLRVPAGAPLSLTLRRAGQSQGVKLTSVVIRPAEIALRVATKVAAGKKIGWLKLSLFLQNTGTHMRTAVAGLVNAGVAGLVLDLRDNPGGALNACLDMGGLFLGTKPLAQIRTRAGISPLFASGEQMTQLPLVVLVNAGTASAAEVLAAGLRSQQRAQLLGTRTFGKGLLHGLQQLSDGSVLQITQGSIQTLEGKEILHEGISPQPASSAEQAAITAVLQEIARRPHGQ